MDLLKFVPFLIITIALAANAASGADLNWYRGHIHGHSTNSDGNLPPDKAAAWYRDHGYNFVAVTDHNQLTDPAGLKGLETPNFILVPGTEINDRPQGKEAHCCGIFITKQPKFKNADNPAASLQRMTNAIRESDGICQINHPNWKWGLSAADIRPVRGALLLEVYNMAGDCANDGDAALGKPSTESMWDDLLTSGKTIYATATDDVHAYTVGDPNGPGKGWIMVRAAELSPEALKKAISKGDFYASSGVYLRKLQLSRRQMTLEVDPKDGMSYTIDFIGEGGRVLQSVKGTSATYQPPADTSYVRARVRASDGTFALTQPVF